jgi:hypothetical protein
MSAIRKPNCDLITQKSFINRYFKSKCTICCRRSTRQCFSDILIAGEYIPTLSNLKGTLKEQVGYISKKYGSVYWNKNAPAALNTFKEM